ncbi:MAG: peptidoglycan-binding protein [Oscillatoriaceae bacterium SKW80]|nr:peptidoglycan-binding protein [Oscillatoriaceae bacterium SKW80]
MHPTIVEKPASFTFKTCLLLLRWLKLPLALFILSTTKAVHAASPGDFGETVSCIQQQLYDFGYFYGPFTGYYGPLTQKAVTRFQQDYGLQVDGIAGVATLRKLGCISKSDNKSSGYDGEILSRGSRGSRVYALQRDLTAVGFYNGPITGYFGSLTEQAVIRFQRYYGLRADGIAGSSTLSKLVFALSGKENVNFQSGNLARGSRGSRVYALQRDLTAVGFYNGPITGYFGSLTEQAVIRFQRYYGLRVDGIVGPSTQRLLYAMTFR